jgi:PAS domain S-box-containing protein
MPMVQRKLDAARLGSSEPPDFFSPLATQLAATTAGLSRAGLAELFIQNLMDSAGAESVCVCAPSDRGSWVILASKGRNELGCAGQILGDKETEWILRSGIAGEALVRDEGSLENALKKNSEKTTVAVPLMWQQSLLGAAILVLEPQALQPTAKTLERLNLLARFFSGLFYTAGQFENLELVRKRWVRVIDAIPDMLLVHDEAGKIIRTNRRFAERLHVNPVTLVGCDTRMVVEVADVSQDAVCPLCAAAAEDIAKPIEIFGERSFLVSAERLAAEGPESAQIIHVITDTRERMEMEAALQRERDFSQRVLDSTNSLIVVLDSAGVVQFINRRGQLAGYAPALQIGRAMSEALHPAHRRPFEESLNALLRGESARNLELPVLRKDGRGGLFATNLSAIQRGEDRSESFVAVMADITETSILQAEFAHAGQAADLGQLVPGVVHGINNPLAAIVGFSELLLENNDLPESARATLGTILQEAQRGSVLVQNLLRLAPQTPRRPESVGIHTVLRQAVQLRTLDDGAHAVEIVDRLGEQLPPVSVDPHQFRQVFLYILKNSFEAIDESGRNGRIELEAEVRGGMVEIRIRDNGAGVHSPERVFEPFFTTKSARDAAGLGLSHCYGIVRAHEGEIVCRNNSGAPGCTILIRLPVAGSEPCQEPA